MRLFLRGLSSWSGRPAEREESRPPEHPSEGVFKLNHKSHPHYNNTRKEIGMEKCSRPFMLAVIVLCLMPLRDWATSQPAGSLEGNRFRIIGGSCEVSPNTDTVDLQYDPETHAWKCEGLEALEEGTMGSVAITLRLLDRASNAEEDPSDYCAYAGGIYAGGHCWYRGEEGDSCNRVCQDAGGRYSEATATEVGSIRDGGTQKKCTEVADLFGRPRAHPRGRYGRNRGLGCSEQWSVVTWWMRDGPTTGAARDRDMRRFCACEAPY